LVEIFFSCLNVLRSIQKRYQDEWIEKWRLSIDNFMYPIDFNLRQNTERFQLAILSLGLEYSIKFGLTN
jgi:hypothetical protein